MGERGSSTQAELALVLLKGDIYLHSVRLPHAGSADPRSGLTYAQDSIRGNPNIFDALNFRRYLE